MDYIKLNQGLTPVASAIPVVVSLLEQISTSSGPWYAAIFVSRQSQQYTFTVLPTGVYELSSPMS